VPWAVSGWFEAGAEAWVRDCWEKLAAAGIDSSLHEGPYRPHVTFGVWESLADGAADAIARFARETAPLTLRCESLGVFTEPEAVVFLAALQTHRLSRTHESLHGAIAPVTSGAVAHYEPGHWLPHCTLAWHLRPEDIASAVATAAETFTLPLSLRVDRLGLVETPAEVERAVFPLTG
jgi:2'-5' RNA ligase